MRIGLLPILRCPDCSGELRLASKDGHSQENRDIETGALACAKCGREFPIRASVPRLYPGRDLERPMRSTKQKFGWEWDRYPGSLEEDRRIFLEESQLSESDLAGRLVLDAGCGMGRYSVVALGLEAEVVAFDLSDALLRMIPLARENPRLHLVQGDLLRPPFKAGAFDVAYSHGVLHHTPDTRAAFQKTASLVKPGGRLSAWVYGTPGPYRSFSTNPLKSDRKWLKALLPLVWIVVWTRQALSDALRIFTTRLPTPLLYALCYPLAFIGAIPAVKYLTFSVHPNFRVRLIENFDWLAPPYQYKHTKEEVRAWFERERFGDLRQLAHGVVPKVGFSGKKLSGIPEAARSGGRE